MSKPATTQRMRYRREWQRSKRRSLGIQPVQLAGCGTTSAYRRHLRNGEAVDCWCNDAHNADSRRSRAVNRLKRAQKLIAQHTATVKKLTDEGLRSSPAAAEARSALKDARAAAAEAKAAIAAAVADMEKARAGAAKEAKAEATQAA